MNSAATQSEVPLAYKAIKQRLLRHLRTGYPVGSRLPPIPELAHSLGTGQVNTYRAVRELVKEGVLASRRRHGSFVARQPTTAEVGSRQKPKASPKHRVMVIHATGYVAPAEGFVGKMVEGFRQTLLEAGIEPVVRPTDLMHPVLPGPEEADAIVLFNPNGRPLVSFHERQVALVVQTAVEAPLRNSGRYDLVSVEQEQGGQLAGELLRDSGQAGVCFVGAQRHDKSSPELFAQQPYDPVSTLRLAGFERGLGQPLPDSHRLLAFCYGMGAGARIVPDFLQITPRPRAVFAASDEIAMGFMAGMLAHRLVAGRDYRLVGFDGQQAGQQLDSDTGSLTSVCVPASDMGRRGAQLLLERLNEPNQPVRRMQLGCTLYRGQTA